mmetsp:Transcript_15962/g.34477  ORF Transcript_15962/g.34477 Transcript_15962/m.34477 type:complete len:624 (+) Transcript_15962:123-1994(+)|eukprot:CAMPEP_0202902036 /NCGR_PEP_ID=MMETSP1392-20130828/15969_1 /ASSEMBLY_ACC=CAM_ASM_000868 /TAXON_ID=225041 /ORGANISM="Chlamydomonas chlamydogama, Strain SAG 11-48b" /LENGTH=623 /DNA_ID=CAMNT_0049588717 /DNA_START=117 /DNA_END=1988 /DNA_ORIENTATION=-
MLLSAHAKFPVFGSLKSRNNARQARVTAAASKLNAVLERPVPVEEIVAARKHELVQDASIFETSFDEYQAATQFMQDLESLSHRLLSNLNELNTAETTLSTLAPAMPHPPAELSQEERRRKRAAAREARKAKAAPPANANTQPGISDDLDAQLAALTRAKEQLDALVENGNQVLQQHSARLGSTSTSSSDFSRKSGSVVPSRSATISHPASVETDEATSSPPQYRSANQTFDNPVGTSLSTSMMGKSSLLPEPSATARALHSKRATKYSRHRGSSQAAQVKGGSRSSLSSDATTQFMKQASSLDLLNGVGEKELATVVKDLLWLERVRAELEGIVKREPTMQEWATAVGMNTNEFAARLSAGRQAKTLMLQSNYRLVICICKKYQNRGIALQDLITEGMQGLLKGVERFDPSKGFRFSTYAHWWIRQAVTRSLSEQSRTVRLPVHMFELLTKVAAVRENLVLEMGKEPPVEVVAEKAGVPLDKIMEVLKLIQQPTSLEQPVADGDSQMQMRDMLEDDRLNPEDNLDDVMLEKDLESIITELPEREAGVIQYRFGLSGKPELTLEEIGAQFDVTRERIRQIEAKALRKLKSKQAELLGKLKDYKLAPATAGDMVARVSRGTKKT